MNKEKQHNKLVPELRFPEFDENWEMSELGDKKVSFFVNDKTPKEKLNIETYISTENLLPDYGGVKKSNKLPNSGSFTTYKCGDILIANIRPYLKKVWFADREGTASNDVIVFRAGSSISEYFLQHILKNDIFINYVMKGAKGVKMPRGDKSLMKKYPVYFPNPKEQQKIANCLSSLDNLITAETEKLDYLKDHKKGLLQNLFPTNLITNDESSITNEPIRNSKFVIRNSKQPQYRFPEFVEDGDWEEKELSIALDGKSSQIAKNKLNFTEKGYPVYGADGMLGFIDSFVQKDDYIAIVKDGSGVGNLFFYKGKSSLLGTLNYLISKDNQEYKLKWLYYFLQKINFKSFVKGSTIPHIYYKDYSKLLVLIPSPKEQQKIANCLSSADNLIQAQTEKIAALKIHKKGLMQQLFPNVNDVAV